MALQFIFLVSNVHNQTGISTRAVHPNSKKKWITLNWYMAVYKTGNLLKHIEIKW